MRPDLHEALERLAPDPLTAVRTGCALVAEQARWVRVVESALPAYAEQLVPGDVAAAQPLDLPGLGPEVEERAAFVLMLDAVNFGSGYWPHLRKRAGLSGYRTVEASLLDWFVHDGIPSAASLRTIAAEQTAKIFGQGLEPPIGELMELFARAWRELGEWVEARHGSRFTDLVAAAGGRAENLVEQMLALPMFRDIADYREHRIPLLKRAQIVVADLAAALPPPHGHFEGLDRLTLFADNLIPHVLRIDGILRFDPDLLARIERGQLLVAGSEEEVEMRATAVHAVEGIARECAKRGTRITPQELDRWLWQRGAGARYKAQPRPRARSIYY